VQALSFIITEANNFVGTSRNNKALQTFHRVDRFSRKLQRRLTQHTVAEVKAIRQYSEDALRFVLYTAELVGSTSKYIGRTGDRDGPCVISIYFGNNLRCHVVIFVFTTQYKNCIQDIYLHIYKLPLFHKSIPYYNSSGTIMHHLSSQVESFVCCCHDVSYIFRQN
jgi:hypothetical protein